MPPAFVLSQDQTLMKDFHELDCSLKFADLFIVVLTTFNCWNQMIPYTIFGLSSLFSFQRSISWLYYQLIYHIIFIRRLLTKSFLLLYTNNLILTTRISYHLT